MIRPYLRDLINEHKTIDESNDDQMMIMMMMTLIVQNGKFK